jgi:hypothetical protein
MAKLPNIEQALVEDAKLTAYLLNPAHPRGAAKARFLMSFGFTASEWRRLRDAIIEHARDNEIAHSYPGRYGQVYEVDGPLLSPDGRNPTVLIAWMIRWSEDQPRLVTAVPSRGELS